MLRLCAVVLLIVGMRVLPAAAEETATDMIGAMYWTDRTAGIYRAARDGSEITLVVPRPFIDSIAIDREGKRLFWTAITHRGVKFVQLWQGNLEGGVPKLLADDLNWVGDVVFDPLDKLLYITSIGDAKIIRMNADGNDRKDFVTEIPPPSRMFLDAKNRRLYWASNGRPRIDRVQLDGSGREPVLTNMPGVAFGFAIDPLEQRIYWTYPGGSLYRSKLDGSQRERLFQELTQPDGLAIDVDNRKLYWVEKGKLSHANLDGSGPEALVSGKSDLYSSLEILPPAD